jgi:hypothetical protein
MLLVYVVASNGYQGQPTLTPSFHGATYPTKEDCEAAARTVDAYPAANLNDIGKVGLYTVCAPVNPPPPPPVKSAEQPAPQPQPGFLMYPAAPPPPKRGSHH